MTDHRWTAATGQLVSSESTAPASTATPAGSTFPPAPSVDGEIWAIVVAAGSGSRFGGDVPKQYRALGDARVLDHSLAVMRQRCGERVVLVVSEDRLADDEPSAGVVVGGGATRTDSVRAGLGAVPASASVILVHDAARPLVPVEVVDRLVLAVAQGADGAVPGIAVVDTVKVIDASGVIVATPLRATLRAVQTPQAFRADVLRRVYLDGGDATDDAALVELAGGRVVVVDGDQLARKITTDDDLEWLSEQLRLRAATERATQ